MSRVHCVIPAARFRITLHVLIAASDITLSNMISCQGGQGRYDSLAAETKLDLQPWSSLNLRPLPQASANVMTTCIAF